MNKKILKSLGLISGAGLSTLAFVSCGLNQKDTVKELQFVHSFKEDGWQAKTLQEIFDVWNAHEEVKTGKDLGILLKKSSDPKSVRGELVSRFEVKDTKNLYNLTFAYPAIIPLLKKFDRTLDLKSVSTNETIQKTYLNFNKRIFNKEDGSVLALPVNRSGEILSIDAPVMYYVLKHLSESQNGLFTISSDNDTQVFINELKRSAGITDSLPFGYDGREIEKIWGLPKQNALTEAFEFNVKNLEVYEEVFKFASLVNSVFDKAQTISETKTNKSYGVLGIDSMANPIYSMIFSAVGRDYSKFILNSKDGKKIDYESIFKNGTGENTVLKNVFNTIKDFLKDGSIYIREKDKYSSSYLKNHQLMFTFGSTAGYKYSFVKRQESLGTNTPEQNAALIAKDEKVMNENELFTLLAPKFFTKEEQKDLNSNISIITQGPSLIGIKTTKEKDENTIKFVQWFLTEKVMTLDEEEEKITPLEYFGKKGGYIVPTNKLFTMSELDVNRKYNSFESTYINAAREQINTVEGFEFFEDPVDIYSEDFRNNLDLSVNSFIQRSKANSEENFDGFIKSLQSSMKNALNRK